jgi:hypothetical protein
MAKSTKALLMGRIQMCKTNPSIAHIGLATHGRSIQIGSSSFGSLAMFTVTRRASKKIGQSVLMNVRR